MPISEKLRKHLKSYLDRMNEEQMRLALHTLKQEQKRRKRRKK